MTADEQVRHPGVPTQSSFQDVGPNGSKSLYTGPIQLKTVSSDSASDGSITVILLGEPRVEFTVARTANMPLDVDEGDLLIPAPVVCTPSPFIVTGSSFSSDSIGHVTGILDREGLILQEVDARGKQRHVSRIEFHLINFRHYVGSPLQVENNQKVTRYAGRASFPFGQWLVTIDQFPDTRDRLQAAKASGGYVFTHVGTLARADKKLFGPDAVGGTLEGLHWFLSLVNGSHCGPILPMGFRDGDAPVWQVWAMPTVSTAKSRPNWFSASPPLHCFGAADCFHKCWVDPGKRDWLKSVVGTYLASNEFHGGIELTLATSQILLEMLAWVALLEENSLMSEAGFSPLSVADKVRALLFWLGVGATVPVDLADLQGWADGKDGPDAISRIRNLVIHPTKSNRAQRNLVPNEAIYEAWQFVMWYAELTILKLIGFSGPYNNRIGNPSNRLWDVLPWTRPQE
jgi:hypothetical protein